MTKVCVVHYIGATEKSRSVVASLIADQRDTGASVEVLDIGRWTTISQDLPPTWVARMLGHQAKHQAFGDVVCSLGATIVEPSAPSGSRAQVRDEHRSDVDTAIESELLTYFRVHELPNTRAVTPIVIGSLVMSFHCVSLYSVPSVTMTIVPALSSPDSLVSIDLIQVPLEPVPNTDTW